MIFFSTAGLSRSLHSPQAMRFRPLAAGAAALQYAPHVATAQAYPTRPVRIVVGFAPAGPSDIIARLIGQWLSERLGQQFVIDNRPGAGGNIGTEAVVRSPADGYTLLMVGGYNAINATLYDKGIRQQLKLRLMRSPL
jgi:tripartite-type tricarboxylate transporter receptor subunit TctC